MYWLWERVCSGLLSKIATATSLAREGATIQGTDWAQVQSNPPYPFPFFTLSGGRGFDSRRRQKIIRINFVIRNSNLSSFGICQILLATSLSNFRQQKLFYQNWHFILYSVFCFCFWLCFFKLQTKPSLMKPTEHQLDIVSTAIGAMVTTPARK